MTTRAKGERRVIQRHHIIYPAQDHPEQEVVVSVTKGEHFILGRLQLYTRRRVSRGLITALETFVALNRHRAEEA